MVQTEIREAVKSCVFPPGYRAAGLLMHVTSLPSVHGVGSFGPEAFAWIDHLAAAGQSWWQILPIGPPDMGNSPYMPLSTFASNPLLISPEVLVSIGLLSDQECVVEEEFPADHVDFDRVIPWKEHLLGLAYVNYRNNRGGVRDMLTRDMASFCIRQKRWLDDFAMFVALKGKFGGCGYVDWPEEYRHRDVAALQQAEVELADEIARVKFEQFLVFDQLARVKSYAAQRDVKLFGDLPIFVSADSSDVWANPQLFKLDADLRPQFVAGVPPDYFSATGQLWGNPAYQWSAHREQGYSWWIDRLNSLMQQHDLVRLDHFRGFCAAWNIPAGAPTAETGQWVDGPRADFFMKVKSAMGGLPFVAEDLGTITDDVRQLLADFSFPKMGVLQFAFDGDPTNAFLPQHSVENMVVYTGTHDNDTTLGWYRTLNPAHRDSFWAHLQSEPADSESEVAKRMVEMAWASAAAVTIAPMQDLLGLGGDARMNLPGVADGNWAWRCTPAQMEAAPWDELRELTIQCDRGSAIVSE